MISLNYLMNEVSFVFQDVFLLKKRILDNIRTGNKNTGEEDAVAAAKAAKRYKFIEGGAGIWIVSKLKRGILNPGLGWLFPLYS